MEWGGERWNGMKSKDEIRNISSSPPLPPPPDKMKKTVEIKKEEALSVFDLKLFVLILNRRMEEEEDGGGEGCRGGGEGRCLFKKQFISKSAISKYSPPVFCFSSGFLAKAFTILCSLADRE